MYSSRKYDVETLFKQSTSFLEKSLSEENLCEILEKSHGYGETDLEEKALKMLTKASSTVTQSAAFAQLCSSCFGTFLKSKHLKLKEEEVFEAALSWTKGECEREGLSPSHENMRKVLGKLVYEIRFVIWSLHFLINVVGPSRILTNDERILIMDRQVNENIDVRPFRPEARKPHKEIAIDELELSSEGINYVNRFHSLGNGIHHAGQHALSFSTNRSITLLGCQLYRTDRQPGFSLDIRLYDDHSGLISHPVQDTCWTLRNTVNDIFFPHPISVMAGRVYTIVVYLPSTSTIAGNGGRASVYQGGVKFIFSKSHNFENGSSVEKGQIPALIWRF